MTALGLSRLLPWRTFDRASIARGLGFGTLWGVTVAGALLGLSFYQCGTICLGQITETTALSVAAGLLTIGPLTMFRRRAQASLQ